MNFCCRGEKGSCADDPPVSVPVTVNSSVSLKVLQLNYVQTRLLPGHLCCDREALGMTEIYKGYLNFKNITVKRHIAINPPALNALTPLLLLLSGVVLEVLFHECL